MSKLSHFTPLVHLVYHEKIKVLEMILMVVEKRNPIPVKEAIQRIVNQQSSMPEITVALEKV